MVGETKIYQGQRVQVMGVVNGDEVVIQLSDGSRKPVYRHELTDVAPPQSNRPIITKSGPLAVTPVTNESASKPQASAGNEQALSDLGAVKNDVEKETEAKTETPAENTVPTVVVDPPAAPEATEPPPAPTEEVPF